MICYKETKYSDYTVEYLVNIIFVNVLNWSLKKSNAHSILYLFCFCIPVAVVDFYENYKEKLFNILFEKLELSKKSRDNNNILYSYIITDLYQIHQASLNLHT